MTEQIKKQIVTQICNDYVEVIMVGLEEYQELFLYTTSIINFLEQLNKNNTTLSIEDVFKDTFIDKMYVEINNYIGGNYEK